MSDAADRHPSSPSTEPSPPADLDTRGLFGDRTEIRIAHGNAIYRLRITRAGKLILNK